MVIGMKWAVISFCSLPRFALYWKVYTAFRNCADAEIWMLTKAPGKRSSSALLSIILIKFFRERTGRAEQVIYFFFNRQQRECKADCCADLFSIIPIADARVTWLLPRTQEAFQPPHVRFRPISRRISQDFGLILDNCNRREATNAPLGFRFLFMLCWNHSPLFMRMEYAHSIL